MLCRIKKVLIFLGLVFACIATARFCHKETQGFRLAKVQDNLFRENTSILANNEEVKLLQQKFYFLARGLQSFVFVSEDGKYVLKLFNNRYQKKIQLFSLLFHFPIIQNWASERLDYYQSKFERTAKSYEIALQEMKDKTGLVYLHLGKTSNLPSHLSVVDKLHICHDIDPNHTGFLIQKRANLVYPEIQNYINNQDINGAKQAISSLIALFFWKWQHEIDDNDPLIRTNYGFIDGKAIQIDVGPLSKRTCLKPREEYEIEMQKVTASLKFYLEGLAPELIPFLEDELKRYES